ncbi:unnamed protein product [Linum trigynum]
MQVTQVVVTHSQPLTNPMHPMGPMGTDPGVGIYIQPVTSAPMSPMSNSAAGGQGNPYFGMQYPQQAGGGQYIGMGMAPQLPMYPQQQQQLQQLQLQQQQQQLQQQQQMYSNQMAGYGGYGGGMYGQQPQQHQLTPQQQRYLEQKMYGMSVRDDSSLRSSSSYGLPSSNSSSMVPKPSKPEDKLFGDLVDLTKFKPAKTPGGSM